MSVGKMKRALFKIPVCTRWLDAFSLLLPLLCGLRVLGLPWFILDRDDVLKRLQLWRLVTCFFVNGMNIGLLLALLGRHQYSAKLERGVFGGTRKYLVFLASLWAVLGVSGLLSGQAVMWGGLDLALVQYWALHFPNTPAVFLHVLTVPGKYIPFIKLAFDLLIRGNVVPGVLGILSANLIYFIYNEAGLQLQFPGIGEQKQSIHRREGYSVNKEGHDPKVKANLFRGSGTKVGTSVE